MLAVLGGHARGILQVSLPVNGRGQILWNAVATIYVGDVDRDQPRFYNSLFSCLTSGENWFGEGSSKFSKLLTKGSITTTAVPCPAAVEGIREVRLVSAGKFKVTLTSSLYDAAEGDAGFMLPRREAGGRNLAWFQDDTTGEQVSRFSALGPHLPAVDGLVDIRTLDDIQTGRASEEVVFAAIMELEEEGVLNIYEQEVNNTPIYGIYHALRDHLHARAQVPMRS